MRLLARFVVATALALAHAAGAMGQPIHVGYTATGDFFPLFVAKEEGYFAKRGLDVEPVLLALNPMPIRCRSAGPPRRSSCRRSMAASISWRSPAAR